MNHDEKIKSLEKEIEALKIENAQLKGQKYRAKSYTYFYEEQLSPPAYQPSSEEIALAKARYVFENNIWEIFYYLGLYIDFLEGKSLSFPDTEENVKKRAKASINFWEKSLEKWDDNNNIWDCFLSDEWFKAAYVDGLSDTHGGDCTAYAGSCMRCHAEQMFKIPYTANWDKHKGYKMYQAYIEDIKKKKSEGKES